MHPGNSRVSKGVLGIRGVKCHFDFKWTAKCTHLLLKAAAGILNKKLTVPVVRNSKWQRPSRKFCVGGDRSRARWRCGSPDLV